MTRNLRWYMVFSVAWSLLFFWVLHWALFDQPQRWPYILAAGVTYGIGLGMMGALLGRYDSQAKSRHNLSLLYGLTSNSISFLLGGLWLVLFRGDHWWELLTAVIFFALSLGLQIAANRGRIKGMSKQELFK